VIASIKKIGGTMGAFQSIAFTIYGIIKKIVVDPRHAVRVLRALVRGCYYALYFRVVRRNVRIRFPFKAFAKVTIIGPGRVILGKNCVVAHGAFKGLTIVTLSEDATVRIGEHCHLAGLTICCCNHVELGSKSMTAVSLIQDCLFVNHSFVRTRGKHAVNESEAIAIGSNAWLSNDAIILSGSKIGADCVVSVGSVCRDMEVKPYSLAMGNPVRRGLPIANVMRMTGST
jgi:acetyltransferase-like isoleucine patch superfamily enzyme